jgi:hypothetical protein
MNTGGNACLPFPQFPQISPRFPTYFTTGFTTLFAEYSTDKTHHFLPCGFLVLPLEWALVSLHRPDSHRAILTFRVGLTAF